MLLKCSSTWAPLHCVRPTPSPILLYVIVLSLSLMLNVRMCFTVWTDACDWMWVWVCISYVVACGVCLVSASQLESLHTRRRIPHFICCSSFTHTFFAYIVHIHMCLRWIRICTWDARALVRFLYVYISVAAMWTHVKCGCIKRNIVHTRIRASSHIYGRIPIPRYTQANMWYSAMSYI